MKNEGRKLHVVFFFRIHAFYNLITLKIRIVKFKLLGGSIGENVKIGRIFIPVPEQVQISDDCVLEDNVRLRVGGAWKAGGISIGKNTFIGHSTQINIGTRFSIGDNCLIAPGCIFADAYHGFSDLHRNINKQECTYKPIVIENNVWVGSGVIILGGVTVGEGVVIAAGSVVNKSIPAYEVWGGVPAKKLKNRA